jgi:hypothetical protein
MNRRTQLRIAVAALTCAAVAAPAALGAGEPKNQPPFTQAIGPAGFATTVHDRYVAGRAAIDPAGEPKNQLPFTRSVATNTATAGSAVHTSIAGEPKNDVPFIRGVSRTPVVVRTRDGFDWGDAGIGAVVVLGLGCVALGGVAVRAASIRRPRTTGA